MAVHKCRYRPKGLSGSRGDSSLLGILLHIITVAVAE